MARSVANLDILTENFEAWVVRTNTLLDALSFEIITANSSWANTGNSTVMRNAQLYGKLVANTIYLNDALSGGSNTTTTANLNITSNALFTGASVNVASNATLTGLTFFTSNVQANGNLLNILGTTMNVSSNVAVVSNNQSFSSNSIVQALYITGNATVTNTAIAGNNFNVSSTNTYLTGINIISSANILSTANSQLFKSNGSITAISIQGNSLSTNTTVGGTDFNISSNVAITGVNHTISGNVNVDSATLFVDATNNRVGLSNSTPDATLSVTGTANVSANTRVGGVFTVANDTIITGFANVTTSVNSAILSVGTAFVANSLGAFHTGTINAASHTTTGVTINTTAIVPTSNSSGQTLGNSISRFVVSANSIDATGAITGITANLTTSVNSALLTVGTEFIANSLGAFHTGTVNAASITTTGVRINTTAIVPTSNSSGQTLGNSISRFVLSANSIDATGAITGITANLSTSVNSALLTVGTAFVANSLGAFHTGTINAASHTTTGVTINTTAIVPTSNSSGQNLGNSISRFVLSANTIDATGAITGVNLVANSLGVFHTGTINAASHTVGTDVIANSTGVFTTGTVNAAAHTIGSTLVANTTQLLYTNVVSFSNTLAVTGAATLSNTLAVTGNATLSNRIAVTGNATLSNTLAVTGATTLSNTLSVGGNVAFTNSIVTIRSDYVIDVYANSDIGSNSTAQVVYSFPKGTYRAAKVTAIAAKGGNNMISEMIVVHDGTTPFMTTYATVSSPPSANNTALLGTYSTQINNANVEILLAQSTLGGNSSVKFVAHLIK